MTVAERDSLLLGDPARGYPPLLRRILGGATLSARESEEALGAIFDGRLSDAQAAGVVVALAQRGETKEEVVGAAVALRRRAVPLPHRLPLVLDVVGTGGDQSHSLNVSTGAALVVAGAGVPVAKHGNRAASSRCGSADVLEALGVPLDREPQASAELLERHRIAFLFAPRYHPAMRQAAGLRTQLGVRTIFNLLGPLCNPAGAQRLLVGVFAEDRLDLVADALLGLGAERGAVVHARAGMDEVAGEGPTSVAEFSPAGRRRWTLDPADYGVRASRAQLRGGGPRRNAGILLQILRGAPSPAADVVCLNAALALVVAGAAADVAEGLELARLSLRSGAALQALEALRGTSPAGAAHA